MLFISAQNYLCGSMEPEVGERTCLFVIRAIKLLQLFLK